MVLSIAYRIFKMMGDGHTVDDDSSDRLSYRVTACILVASATLIGLKQMVGDPISCWIPAHFTGNHEGYTNSYCWIRNTYYLPWDEEIPREHEHDKRQMITYYQWIPLILMLQALCFYIPRVIWTNLNGRVGIDINMIMANAENLQNSQKFDDHTKTLDNMASHMHRMFQRQQAPSKVTLSLKSCLSRICCNACGRKKGNYLLIVFLVHKLFYIANLFAQLFVLNHVLGFKFNEYGIEVLRTLYQGREYTDTPFPRVTFCDMNIRRLGNVHRYAVQCVLPINLYTEKLYLFQWFWYVLLLTLALIEFIQWIVRVAVWQKSRISYVMKQLHLAHDKFDDDNKMILEHTDEFCDEYLKQDGVFILRLMAKNSTQGVACLVTQALWEKFLPWYKAKEARINKDLNEPKSIDEPDYGSKPPYSSEAETMPLRRGRH